MKCALAIIVAFSAVIGRSGAFECLLATIFGTIGYEINRQIIGNIGIDSFGTFSIFSFGGSMGLTLGVFLKVK
jgi:hypothetical protein